MAIAVAQSVRTDSAFSASRTVTFGAAPSATDLVLVALFIESSASITIPSGFTLLGSYVNTGVGRQSVIAYKYNDTGNSYQFSWSGSSVHWGTGLTFSGVDSTTPIDVLAGAWDENNFSPLTIESVTTATDAAMHVMACYHSNGNDGAAVTGYTRYFNGVADTRGVYYTKEITSAGATGQQTVDFGTEFYCQGISFALRPEATATKGFPFPSRSPMAHLLVR